MKNSYIHDNFLLQSPLAEELYHGYAEELPTIDFHCHLNPGDISSNRGFSNIADAWVLHDPYKHRAMRMSGICESGITGDAGDYDKFLNWARTVPKTLGNPLYTWAALELSRLFDVHEQLSEKNAREIWTWCNELLRKDGFGTRDILKKFNAEIVCTSDDLLDELAFHTEWGSDREIKMFPSLRGDSILGFGTAAFDAWFARMEEGVGATVESLIEYKEALVLGMDRFSLAGCRLADHSLDAGFVLEFPSEEKAGEIFRNWVAGQTIGQADFIRLKSHLIYFLAGEYAKRGWIMQLHIGAVRYTSSRLRSRVGAAGGYAAIGAPFDVTTLCMLFDELEKSGDLPEVILYNLNPSDNESFATLSGSFVKGGVAPLIQFGPAWWYNDQYDGIRRQMKALASYGLLAQFIGMTTDSRSVFSFSRHEYYRRILCNELAEWVQQGIIPNDIEILSGLVRDLSYNNCKHKIFNR